MNKRNGEIDVLRFVVCLMIVLYHFCQIYGFDKFSLCTMGNIGVEFFFVVSGYLMAVHTSKLSPAKGNELVTDTWNFILKKIGYFYKYFIAGIIVQIVLYLVYLKHLGARDIIHALLQGIPQFTLTTMGLDFNHRSLIYLSNSWYLSVMILASFILYPLLRRYEDAAKKLLFPLTAIFILGYLYGSFDKLNAWQKWNGHLYLGFLRGLSEMALGASLHALAESLSVRFSWLIESEKVVPKLILTVMKIGCYLVFFMFGKGVNLGEYFSIHALLFVSLGITLSFMNVGYTIRDSKLTRFLGKISLPIFIFHGVFRNLSYKLVPLRAGENAKLLLLVGATVCICLILYFLTDIISALLGKAARKIKRRITEN